MSGERRCRSETRSLAWRIQAEELSLGGAAAAGAGAASRGALGEAFTGEKDTGRADPSQALRNDAQRHDSEGLLKWRRGWDSNPR